MTDEEMIRACAEKVMGWQCGTEIWGDTDQFVVIVHKPDGSTQNWNPLARDQDACAVLDKMEADGYGYSLVLLPPDIGCWFTKWQEGEPLPDSSNATGRGIDRKRAIVLAALRAKGVEVWDAA